MIEYNFEWLNLVLLLLSSSFWPLTEVWSIQDWMGENMSQLNYISGLQWMSNKKILKVNCWLDEVILGRGFFYVASKQTSLASWSSNKLLQKSFLIEVGIHEFSKGNSNLNGRICDNLVVITLRNQSSGFDTRNWLIMGFKKICRFHSFSHKYDYIFIMIVALL